MNFCDLSKIGYYPGAGKGPVTDTLGISHTSLLVMVQGVGMEEHSVRNQNEGSTGLAGSGYDVSPSEIGPVCTIKWTVINTRQKNKYMK